jgi:hypothetical protein
MNNSAMRSKIPRSDAQSPKAGRSKAEFLRWNTAALPNQKRNRNMTWLPAAPSQQGGSPLVEWSTSCSVNKSVWRSLAPRRTGICGMIPEAEGIATPYIVQAEDSDDHSAVSKRHTDRKEALANAVRRSKGQDNRQWSYLHYNRIGAIDHQRRRLKSTSHRHGPGVVCGTIDVLTDVDAKTPNRLRAVFFRRLGQSRPHERFRIHFGGSQPWHMASGLTTATSLQTNRSMRGRSE